nr:PREDICTED: 60S ribosomal protein L7a [Anolis carolinensis]|eukprot:XP_008123512.1 PREDICTED: 60S ribosomal protein L7a [Anolis carolinensis]
MRGLPLDLNLARSVSLSLLGSLYTLLARSASLWRDIFPGVPRSLLFSSAPPDKMPKGKKAKGKKVAPAPAVVKKQEAKKVVNPLFEKRPKNFGIGA